MPRFIFSNRSDEKNSDPQDVLSILVGDGDGNQLSFDHGYRTYNFVKKEVDRKKILDTRKNTDVRVYFHKIAQKHFVAKKMNVNSVDIESLVRAKREIDALKDSIHNEHIVAYYGICKYDKYVWLCMEFMDMSLHAFYEAMHKDRRHFPEYLLRYAGSCILDGLSECFLRGILHRDIKPHNILVNRQGEVKLCDFGLAKIADSITITNVIPGTMQYQPPERIDPDRFGLNSDQQPDERTDIWSFGVTLAEMAYGKHPYFDGTDPFFTRGFCSTPDEIIDKSFSYKYSFITTGLVRLCLERFDRRPKYPFLMQSLFYQASREHKKKNKQDMRLFVEKFYIPLGLGPSKKKDPANIQFERAIVKKGLYHTPKSFKNFYTASIEEQEPSKSFPISRDTTTVPDQVDLDHKLPVKFNPYFNLHSRLSATWLGNTSLFVHLDNLSLITEPWFQERYENYSRQRKSPCRVDEVPKVDVVLASYFYDVDALDHFVEKNPSLKILVSMRDQEWKNKNKNRMFYNNIKEMTWNEKYVLKIGDETYEIWCVPSQNETEKSCLYCGFVVVGPTKRFFFMPSSGLCESEFSKIGDKFGPIDLSGIQIGGWNDQVHWKQCQMDANDAVKAHRLVKSRKSIGINWGTFKWPYENFLEPRKKLMDICESQKIKNFMTLKPGDTIAEDD